MMDAFDLKNDAITLIALILQDSRPNENMLSLALAQNKLQSFSFPYSAIWLLNQLVCHLRSYSYVRQKFDTQIRPRDGALIYPQTMSHVDDISSNLAAEVLVYVEDLEEILGVENNDWQVVCRQKRFYNRDKGIGEEEEQSDSTECGSDEDAIY